MKDSRVVWKYLVEFYKILGLFDYAVAFKIMSLMSVGPF